MQRLKTAVPRGGLTQEVRPQLLAVPPLHCPSRVCFHYGCMSQSLLDFSVNRITRSQSIYCTTAPAQWSLLPGTYRTGIIHCFNRIQKFPKFRIFKDCFNLVPFFASSPWKKLRNFEILKVGKLASQQLLQQCRER